MTDEKFRAGAFVFARPRGVCPHDPDSVADLAARHGIDRSLVPGYAGDRVAVSRALTQASAGLAREGFLLRPIKRTSTDVVFGIVREQKDESDCRLDHAFEATVSWSAEPDPSVVSGDHQIAVRVAEAYRCLRGKVVSDDWSAAIASYLEDHDAARVRGDGRVYWVPPQRVDDIRRFGCFLADVGIDLVLCEIEAEARSVADASAHQTLEEQLDQLQKEAAEFDGTQRPSTYARRLDEYQRLRERAGLYRDALGLGVSRAEEILADLERRVSSMLDIRRQTVIHRDGNNAASNIPAEASASAAALRFAGAEFTLATENNNELIFTSGDEYAVASVHSLESMGLTDCWQAAGPAKVMIKNSGPPGADVTISIRLPDGHSLRELTASLASLGIEVSR